MQVTTTLILFQFLTFDQEPNINNTSEDRYSYSSTFPIPHKTQQQHISNGGFPVCFPWKVGTGSLKTGCRSFALALRCFGSWPNMSSRTLPGSPVTASGAATAAPSAKGKRQTFDGQEPVTRQLPPQKGRVLLWLPIKTAPHGSNTHPLHNRLPASMAKASSADDCLTPGQGRACSVCDLRMRIGMDWRAKGRNSLLGPGNFWLWPSPL